MNKLVSLLLLAGGFGENGKEGKIVVPSYKIKQPIQHTEPSKQKLRKRIGKKNRTNRGKNRGK